jgi:hypothetical protein
MTRGGPIMAALVCAALNVAAAPQLASSRAIYEISLAHTTGGGVVSARGRMAVEFRDTCDGWSTTQRLIADMADSRGAESRTDFFVSAWESKDGHTMRFDVMASRNGKSDGRRRGAASLVSNGSGNTQLIQGKPPKFSLPQGTQFPTGQTLGILRAAQNGDTAFRHIVFQGGTTSDVYLSTAIIGRASDGASAASDHKADRNGLLRGMRAWPVLIGFFPEGSRAETPDFEVAARLYPNGINGSMSLIYPTYTLRAALVSLEALSRSC